MLVERKWMVLALLFSSIAVNLIDRQTLSILAPVIRDELHLSNTQYSVIIFYFLLGMTIFQVPAGMLVPPMFRLASVVSVVASLAPVRQTRPKGANSCPTWRPFKYGRL